MGIPRRDLWDLIRDRIDARCEEVGECRIYTGCDSVSFINEDGGKSTSLVRRVYWIVTGRPLKRGYSIVSRCQQRNCVACLDQLTASGRNKLAGSKMAGAKRSMNSALAKRRKSRWSDAVIADVKACETAAEASRRHGMSKWYAASIRAGRYRKDFSQPFSGLL